MPATSFAAGNSFMDGGGAWIVLDVAANLGSRRAETDAGMVAAQLRPWPPLRVLEAMIVIDELATNAFLHGRPPYIARVILAESGRAVTLELHDGGPPAWQWELGSGLRLVASVAADWGVRRRRFGTVVWAQLSLDPPVGSVPLPEAEMRDVSP